MAVLETLLEITIYSAIIFVAIMLIKLCFKNKISPFLQYAIWGIFLLRLMLPVTIESSVHFFTLPSETTVSTQEAAQDTQKDVYDFTTSSSGLSAKEQNTVNSGRLDTSAESAGQGNDAVAATGQATWLTLPQILLIIWLGGAAVCLCYFAALAVLLKRNVAKRPATPSFHLLMLVGQVKDELGIKANLKLRCQDGYGTPALLFPRTVFLPVHTLSPMDDEQIRNCIRHECMHYKRGDQFANMLLLLLNAVYWFNPFIWIAFYQIRRDMESACDSAVVRHMNTSARRDYATLILGMFSLAKHRQIALGMVQGNTKKIAEKRIRGVFMNNKSNRKVKVTAILLISLLLFTCFTTACQPTPENEVVVNKDDGALESKLSQTSLLSGRYEAPDTYQTSFSQYDNRLTIQVDATVELPDTFVYPVVTFEHSPFSQEQVDTMVDVLMNGATMYEKSDTATKNELNQQLIDLKKEYEDLKNGIDDTDGDQTLEDYEEMIDQLEEEIVNAPDNVERQTVTSDYYSENDYLLNAEADIGREETANLRINEEMMDFRIGNGYYWDGTDVEVDQLNLSISKEQAVEKATQLIEELNIDYMEPAVVMRAVKDVGEEETDEAYYILFTRSYNNIPTTYVGLDSMSSDYDEPTYLEQISVIIDDDGIMSVTWTGNGSVQGILNENVELLSFQEAMERFAQQITLEYSFEDEEEDDFIQGMTIYIKKITLGYMEIQQKDSNTNILIPAWNFFGFSTTEYDEKRAREIWEFDGETEAEIEERLQEHINNNLKKVESGVCGLDSILSLNAVDGSVINLFEG